MPGVWIAAALSMRSLSRGLMLPWWSYGPLGISARVCVGGGKVAAATPPKGLKERRRRLYIFGCSVVALLLLLLAALLFCHLSSNRG